ncbi:MAG: hypothetical protein KDC49_09120 [Saprospiraceae bacterium]|nr:hypothetical protein [Saprospiraceae bacterium]
MNKFFIFLTIVCLSSSCYKEYDPEERDWHKEDAIISINGHPIPCTISCILKEDSYIIYYDMYIDLLKYHGIISNLPKSRQEKRGNFNFDGSDGRCAENCTLIYGMFDQSDIASTHYYLDTNDKSQFFILEDISKRKISISLRMALIRDHDTNDITKDLGLSRLVLEGEVLDIPVRRFK